MNISIKPWNVENKFCLCIFFTTSNRLHWIHVVLFFRYLSYIAYQIKIQSTGQEVVVSHEKFLEKPYHTQKNSHLCSI